MLQALWKHCSTQKHRDFTVAMPTGNLKYFFRTCPRFTTSSPVVSDDMVKDEAHKLKSFIFSKGHFT